MNATQQGVPAGAVVPTGASAAVPEIVTLARAVLADAVPADAVLADAAQPVTASTILALAEQAEAARQINLANDLTVMGGRITADGYDHAIRPLEAYTTGLRAILHRRKAELAGRLAEQRKAKRAAQAAARKAELAPAPAEPAPAEPRDISTFLGCRLDPDGIVPVADLYRAYCEYMGDSPLGLQEFGFAVSRTAGVRRVRLGSGWKPGRRVYHYRGVGLGPAGPGGGGSNGIKKI